MYGYNPKRELRQATYAGNVERIHDAADKIESYCGKSGLKAYLKAQNLLFTVASGADGTNAQCFHNFACNLPVLNALIEIGADYKAPYVADALINMVDVKNRKGYLGFVAAHHNYAYLLKALLKLNPTFTRSELDDTAQKSITWPTLLHAAAHGGAHQSMKIILSSKFGTKAKKLIKQDPQVLINTMRGRNKEALALCYQHGANPLQPSHKGKFGNAIEALLDSCFYAGLPATLKAALKGTWSIWGTTPERRAILNRINKLQSNNGTTALMLVLRLPDTTQLDELLLSDAVDLTLTTKEGYSAFHVCAANGNVQQFERLKNYCEQHKLDFNKLVDAQDLSGYTPLLYAGKLKNYEVFDWLLKVGADVTKWHPDQGTALHQMIRQRQPQRGAEIVARVPELDARADFLLLETVNGVNAVDLTQEQGYQTWWSKRLNLLAILNRSAPKKYQAYVNPPPPPANPPKKSQLTGVNKTRPPERAAPTRPETSKPLAPLPPQSTLPPDSPRRRKGRRRLDLR